MKFYTNVQLLGDNILYRGYDCGEQIVQKKDFSPKLFVRAQSKTKFTTLDKIYVEPIKFAAVSDARDFIKKYQEVMTIYGNDRFLYQFISKEFPEEEINYDPNLIKIFSLDIETTAENGFPNVEEAIEQILCITIKDFTTKKIYTWGQGEFVNKNPELFYEYCKDEKELLTKFINWWVPNTPDIITGWNVNMFDIPFLCRRMEKTLSRTYMKSISPWNNVKEREVEVNNRKHIAYQLTGISILDYLDLYKKFTYKNQESYRLDHIAMVELNQQKLDHSEFETFRDFYRNNWQKFIEYNIHDVELVDRLEEKMKLIKLAVKMAYDAKVNYEDVYSQVKTWDAIIYNYLLKDNIVIPPKTSNRKDKQFEGAYVKEPKPGFYNWVVSFDLDSLYPHLIMQYNLSPETYVEEKFDGVTVDKILDQEVDFSEHSEYCVCPNGSMYRKDVHGFLPKLMQKIYDERKEYKKLMLAAEEEYEKTKNPKLLNDISTYKNIQMARKIQLNSAYGAIGNEHFRYYRLDIAEGITLSGKLTIRWIEKEINSYLNKILKTDNFDYVIASDTDSIYLNLSKLVTTGIGENVESKKVVDVLDKFCQTKIQNFIDSSFKKLADYVNAYQHKMRMKRETIAEKGIWTGKKHYILSAWDVEGVRYEKPKLKIMGMESVKSSTPAFFRKMLNKSFELIMTGDNDDVIKFIDDVRTQTKKQQIADISFPRGVKNIAKYKSYSDLYAKGTPIHVRGTILFNHYLKKHNISHKYAEILEGEKIKFIYLKTPNPIGENVIAYLQELPKEFGIDRYIDYELQFSKAFLEPLKSVLDCIGWEVERRNNLSGFFR